MHAATSPRQMINASATASSSPKKSPLPTVRESISENHPALWPEVTPDHELHRLWEAPTPAHDLSLPTGLTKPDALMRHLRRGQTTDKTPSEWTPVVPDGPMYVGTAGFNEFDRSEYLETELLQESYITTAVLRRSGCHPCWEVGTTLLVVNDIVQLLLVCID